MRERGSFFLPGLLLLLLSALTTGNVWDQTDSSFYDVIIPKQLEVDKDNGYKSQVSYMLEVGGEQYVIHLRQKKIFLSATFPVYTYSGSAMLHMEEPYIRDDCYYHGYVEGFTDSLVGISTCYGLRGFLQFRNLSYGIEPLESSYNFQHLIYETEYTYSESMSCGVTYVNKKMYPKRFFQDKKIKEIHVSSQIQYVESFVVVSKGQFDYLKKNETAVIEDIINVINQADAIYESLNVHLMLVGMEIWTTDNLISISSRNAENILKEFGHWKMASLDPRLTFDNAALILREPVLPTVGLAFESKICQPEKSAFYAVFQGDHIAQSAVIFAHELGHCLGMRHDDPNSCNCGGNNNCIMARKAISSFAFSDCSIIDMADFKTSGGTQCLLNIPGTGRVTPSICGDKIKAPDEECDCGTEEQCRSNLCCIFGTCKLRKGANCAHGKCCLNCQLAPAGLTCRLPANECDLPEFCEGNRPECKMDLFKQNGYSCKNNKGYCFDGVCQYHDAQCQAVFGAGTKSADDNCYEEANMQTDRFGNCGFEDNAFLPCTVPNVMCGKIQCVHPITAPTFVGNGTIIYYSPKNILCKAVDFLHASNTFDATWVKDGTKCGTDKLCRNHQCIDIKDLNVKCNEATKCNGRGVCNSKGNCHCNIGWAPPNCNIKGKGGSIDTRLALDNGVPLTRWIRTREGVKKKHGNVMMEEEAFCNYIPRSVKAPCFYISIKQNKTKMCTDILFCSYLCFYYCTLY
ncbi:disintegrin and metalloproteinase domain-containing protein 9-like isoform X2 [Rhinatrema bivittatum]|uniref:disintegrin and metalloproteinase domain-containing protein 9-like isoform X2 n=1 Tax=Rhinatrema bivittatum TaxID=194408 RepID=UPI00112CAE15|nr:disintegrin and metalloproteinase domain-containing protein 9-like isoform X2 [Rhinatrema bivittatum]